MSAPALTLLLCDCVSWRLDLFQAALVRVAAVLREADELAEVTLGYRVADDLALLVLEPQVPAPDTLGAQAAEAGALPGLRTLDLPAQKHVRETVRDKALGSCDLVVRNVPPESAVAQLRARLGMRDDRRTSLRLAVDVPVRFDSPAGWILASARDVSSSGVLVATRAKRPDIGESVSLEFFPESGQPEVRGVALVVRHTPEGFGARLLLSAPAQERLHARLRKQPPPSVPPPPRRERRVPAQVEVALTAGNAVLHERTENLSLAGVFVRTETPPAKGTPVQVELRLRGPERVRVAGEVVRVVAPGTRPEGGGCGVQFEELQPDVHRQIEEFIDETLARRTPRVLLAVASAPRRHALAHLLAKERCDVIEAGSGDEVFERLIEELLFLDLLVLDATLPGTTSAQLMHRLRHLGGEVDLPVALLADAATHAQDEYPGENELLFPALPDDKLVAAIVRLLPAQRSARLEDHWA